MHRGRKCNKTDIDFVVFHHKLWTDLVSFVTKKVDFIETIKVSQAVCFIPTLRENLQSTYIIKTCWPIT